MICPICKKPVEEGAPEFPFCSERCRLLDLGNWASGKYTIPVSRQPEPAVPESDPEDDE